MGVVVNRHLPPRDTWGQKRNFQEPKAPAVERGGTGRSKKQPEKIKSVVRGRGKGKVGVASQVFEPIKKKYVSWK